MRLPTLVGPFAHQRLQADFFLTGSGAGGNFLAYSASFRNAASVRSRQCRAQGSSRTFPKEMHETGGGLLVARVVVDTVISEAKLEQRRVQLCHLRDGLEVLSSEAKHQQQQIVAVLCKNRQHVSSLSRRTL